MPSVLIVMTWLVYGNIQVSMQEFDTQQQCDQVRLLLESQIVDWGGQSGQVRTFCVLKGDPPPAVPPASGGG
jgi:hypothetical protein